MNSHYKSLYVENDVEQISVAFHDRASKLFFSLFRDFSASVAKVDRKKNESAFLEKREQYLNSLQHQLNEVAQQLLRQHPSLDKGHLSQNLNQYINYYIHQFEEKIYDL